MSGATPEYRLALLGYLLYALGALFGVTAVIGAIISHCKLASVSNRGARAHLRVQLISFWLVATTLAFAFWLWPATPARALAGLAMTLWALTWVAGLWQLRRRINHTALGYNGQPS